MKTLILAAGLGTRLAPITDTMPKCMVPVNGKPILIKQIENLHANNIKDITVVAGYKADVLVDAVKVGFPSVNVIVNDDYDTTNNMYSAYLGRNAMQGGNFLMMNADVFFDAVAIKALCEFDSPNAIVTDLGNYMEESMKVIEKEGRIVKISKDIPPESALGNSIDVYKFSSDAGIVFFDKCAEYIIQKMQRGLWSEVALNGILSTVRFDACPLQGRWVEIDNHEDLRNAESIFQ